MTAILRILVAILFIGSTATPRSAAHPRTHAGSTAPVETAEQRTGAPHAGEALDPGDGNQSGLSSEGSRSQAFTSSGAPQDASAVTFEGTLSWVSPSYGDRYLALPQSRGTRAEICGPADCVTRVSTDYGPDQRLNPDRIADLSAADWQRVCGLELRFGLCVGTMTLAGLPATDQGEKP